MTHAPTATHRFAGLAADLTGTDDSRPPLVLLHGLSFDRTMWRPALAELERIDPGRRVLALDLPGHGESPDAPQRDPEQVMHAVHAAVTEAGLAAPVVVGHSLGAVLATFYAANFPCPAAVNVDQTLIVEPFLRVLHGWLASSGDRPSARSGPRSRQACTPNCSPLKRRNSSAVRAGRTRTSSSATGRGPWTARRR